MPMLSLLPSSSEKASESRSCPCHTRKRRFAHFRRQAAPFVVRGGGEGEGKRKAAKAKAEAEPSATHWMGWDGMQSLVRTHCDHPVPSRPIPIPIPIPPHPTPSPPHPNPSTEAQQCLCDDKVAHVVRHIAHFAECMPRGVRHVACCTLPGSGRTCGMAKLRISPYESVSVALGKCLATNSSTALVLLSGALVSSRYLRIRACENHARPVCHS